MMKISERRQLKKNQDIKPIEILERGTVTGKHGPIHYVIQARDVTGSIPVFRETPRGVDSVISFLRIRDGADLWRPLQ
jgi:hypothetical protein